MTKPAAADPELLAHAKLAMARLGVDMDPGDFLTLWQAVYGAWPMRVQAGVLPLRTDGWSRQMEAALRGSVSPEMAKSIAATERLWVRIEDEFGMFTGEEAAERFGLPVRSMAER